MYINRREKNNKEILGKSQIWGETLALNFGSSSQKICKRRHPTFLALSSFIGFLYFVPNILPRIIVFLLHCP